MKEHEFLFVEKKNPICCKTRSGEIYRGYSKHATAHDSWSMVIGLLLISSILMYMCLDSQKKITHYSVPYSAGINVGRSTRMVTTHNSQADTSRRLIIVIQKHRAYSVDAQSECSSERCPDWRTIAQDNNSMLSYFVQFQSV